MPLNKERERERNKERERERERESKLINNVIQEEEFNVKESQSML